MGLRVFVAVTDVKRYRNEKPRAALVLKTILVAGTVLANAPKKRERMVSLHTWHVISLLYTSSRLCLACHPGWRDTSAAWPDNFATTWDRDSYDRHINCVKVYGKEIFREIVTKFGFRV
jgi:hypothetical protein